MDKITTPCFIIDEDNLRNSLEKLKSSLQNSWGNYIIGYSYKTNSLPWIIDFFRRNGCYAEVVSDDEYHLAESIGCTKIIYNGIAKSKETFLKAITEHQIVNIDSDYEINWLGELDSGQYEAGIRVNFDLESLCPGQTQCGADGERFGFCYENGELKDAIDRTQRKGIKISGLHLHKSSKTRMPCIYKAIAEKAVEIKEKYHLDLSYVDIGGGFYGGLEQKPQFPEYFDMVSAILAKSFDPTKTALIVEPGMALIGSNVDYHTTVLDIKKTNRATYIVTDGSRTQIDPLMTKQSYFHEIKYKDAANNTETEPRQIITGFTCMEHDRILEIQDKPLLQPGDQIIYHKVGAYTMTLSPLFIKWFPDVYVKQGKEIIKIRKKWDTPYIKGVNEKQ